jgi:hypothetical protein
LNPFSRILFALIVVLSNNNLKAQTFKLDTMLIKGNYFGKNLYVQNPRLVNDNDTIYTAQQVLVNDSLVLNSTQLQKRAFTIPLTKLHLKEGDAIVVKIVQWNFNRVKILNQEVK